VSEPLTLVINVVGDELAQIPVAIVNPLSGVDSWFNEDEGLVYKVVEFFERALIFLEKDVSLKIRAENYFVATHKT
jgi:hypothetical protein